MDIRFAGQVAESRRDDAHLMAPLHKTLGEGGRHASTAAADGRVFVAEDENFHGRHLL
jgi:hypothetical protein